MKKHNPAHPGEILKELWLEPLGLSVTESAAILGITRKTLSELLNGRSGISTEMAMRLSLAFGTTPESWLHNQMIYDLWMAEKTRVKIKMNILRGGIKMRIPFNEAVKALQKVTETLGDRVITMTKEKGKYILTDGKMSTEFTLGTGWGKKLEKGYLSLKEFEEFMVGRVQIQPVLVQKALRSLGWPEDTKIILPSEQKKKLN